MTELAKCRCGAEAVIRVAGDLDTLHPVWHFVTCATGCHISGPWCDTEGEAIAAWNDLMRPRPVAEWAERDEESPGYYQLWFRGVYLGEVHPDGWVHFRLDGSQEQCGKLAAGRAWLEERVMAAGFEVE